MQPSDVKMYGRDYSAREFTDAEFRQYMQQNPSERRVDFLGRYIGYPGNRKCISAYPGRYRHHLDAGRPIFLFHQIGYTDMEGGYNAGRVHATIALNDARSDAVRWDGESHIVACMDRFYAKAGFRTLNSGDLREYMRGFRSVLGDRAGFYGFYDSMRDAIREGWASFYVQCGARSAHVPGIHCWQENNYQPSIFGTGTDILELYCDPAYAFGGDMGLNPDDKIKLYSPTSLARGDNPAYSEELPLRDAVAGGWFKGSDAYNSLTRPANEGGVLERLALMESAYRILQDNYTKLSAAHTALKADVSKIQTGGVSDERIGQIAKKYIAADLNDDTK